MRETEQNGFFKGSNEGIFTSHGFYTNLMSPSNTSNSNNNSIDYGFDFKEINNSRFISRNSLPEDLSLVYGSEKAIRIGTSAL